MIGLRVRWRSVFSHSFGSDADALTLAATALCVLGSGQKRRGCRVKERFDKIVLSDTRFRDPTYDQSRQCEVAVTRSDPRLQMASAPPGATRCVIKLIARNAGP